MGTYLSAGITDLSDAPLHSVTTAEDGSITLTLYGSELSGNLRVTLSPEGWHSVAGSLAAEARKLVPEVQVS